MIFVKLCFFKLFNNNNVRKLSRQFKKLSRDEKYYHIYMHVHTYIRMNTWADYESEDSKNKINKAYCKH